MAFSVGITGGIGSGKSTVAGIFEVLGIPVLYADQVARTIMHTDPVIRGELQRLFGASIFVQDQLDRKKLAALVFADPVQLGLLNELVHPAAIDYARQWALRQTSPYCVKEAALFFESGSAEGIDLMIGVSSPQALRIQRVMQRDGITREDVLEKMRAQLVEGLKMKLCDRVLINDERQLLMPQVLSLHQDLLLMAQKKNAAIINQLIV
ncbi:MAG: dephospho-CoA kinase [Bacteroidota bacterium]